MQARCWTQRTEGRRQRQGGRRCSAALGTRDVQGLVSSALAGRLMHSQLQFEFCIRPSSQIRGISLLSCSNKIPHTGQPKRRTCVSHSSGIGEVQGQGTSGLDSGELPSPCCDRIGHVAEKGGCGGAGEGGRERVSSHWCLFLFLLLSHHHLI